ncbi:hypothetical protein PHMEG_00038350 [Phytophthora megakarya]|uniref:RxLR effector protein n=1 Tax=Phytophthora megakarya TaxID=4795 RepID=A0A225UI22_9STRA|nr:hypothetical protein PHMEG_00038350 [Phytophthora megakarya]
MRLSPTLLAILLLLVYFDFAVAVGQTAIVASDFVASTGAKNDKPIRSLRVPNKEDITTDDGLVGEDRFIDPLFARAAEILAKICNIGCRSKTVKDLDQWIQDMTIVWHGKAKLKLLYKDLYKHFETIKNQGWNPSTLKEELKIAQKIETTRHANLMKDENYLLWIEFTKYWLKTYKKINID